jgi:hypothetical protein
MLRLLRRLLDILHQRLETRRACAELRAQARALQARLHAAPSLPTTRRALTAQAIADRVAHRGALRA